MERREGRIFWREVGKGRKRERRGIYGGEEGKGRMGGNLKRKRGGGYFGRRGRKKGIAVYLCSGRYFSSPEQVYETRNTDEMGPKVLTTAPMHSHSSHSNMQDIAFS